MKQESYKALARRKSGWVIHEDDPHTDEAIRAEFAAAIDRRRGSR